MVQMHGQSHERVVRSIDQIRSHAEYRPHPSLDPTFERLRVLLRGERGSVPRAEIRRLLATVERSSRELAPAVRNLAEEMVLSLRELSRAFGPSLEIPSRPLLGALPLARVVPQDVHSVADYVGGLTTLAPVFFARKSKARTASAVLGLSVIGVSLLTDYRLSLRKLIPIEAHETIDYLWGASCIAAPFALGYARKDPIATALHVASGAATILTSLFTDYRAAVGRGHSATEVEAIQGSRIQPGLSTHVEYPRP